MTGTVAISWGPSGGFYLHRDFSWRVMHTGGQDDPRATVSGCRACHQAYDSGVSARMARRPAGLGHDCGGRS